jgi:GT2 family glycosyltransferase
MIWDTPQPLPELAISVVLFNSNLEQFDSLLGSLTEALSHTDLSAVPMICVDNSLDSSYALQGRAICDRWQGVAGLSIEWASLSVNGGYGAGHNYGLSQVNSRYHLLLNPDVALDEYAMNEALHLFATHSEMVLLAPVAVGSAGQPEYLAKAYPSIWVLALRAFAPAWLQRLNAQSLDRYEVRQGGEPQGTRAVELASGCCMWVRRDAVDQVGGFDESYFLYFEDYDLSMRLAQVGEVIESRDVKIIHHGGDAARKGWRHIGWFIAGAVRFFRRWGWRWFG